METKDRRGMLRVDKMERCCFFRLGQTPGSIFSPPGQRKPGVVGGRPHHHDG